jgi:hypothetical protein
MYLGRNRGGNDNSAVVQWLHIMALAGAGEDSAPPAPNRWNAVRDMVPNADNHL